MKVQLYQATKQSQLINHDLLNFSEFLRQRYGLEAINVLSDGNCFFHAIEEQLRLVSSDGEAAMNHQQLRQIAVDHMINHPNAFEGFTEETLDNYINRISSNGAWADNPIMQALVNELGISIQVYRIDGTITSLTPSNIDQQLTEPLRIAYTGNHYLSVEQIHVSLNVSQDRVKSIPILSDADNISSASSSSTDIKKQSAYHASMPTLESIVLSSVFQSKETSSANNSSKDGAASKQSYTDAELTIDISYLGITHHEK